MTLVPVDQPALECAAGLGEYGLRALDAVDLTTARSLSEDLETFIAYDQRLSAATRAARRRNRS